MKPGIRAVRVGLVILFVAWAILVLALIVWLSRIEPPQIGGDYGMTATAIGATNSAILMTITAQPTLQTKGP